MLFNSVTFLIFFIIFFILYWFVFKKNLRFQNWLILIASYIFYGWWDWRFVFLLILSTIIDYGFGLLIYKSPQRKKNMYLWLSVFNNLVILGFFKYYNFFADSFKEFMLGLGFGVEPWVLSVVLPVGISFYTFHGMSYVIDIYNNKVKPVNDFVDYAVFVCFFPLLVAGPIERANHLLPQVVVKRNFDYRQSMEGIRLVLWGLFKKIVIADTLAVTVNQIFADYENAPGPTLVLGAIFFAIQIYCDFSGYTDIAIGTAKMLGFELLTNFNFPYFSRDIAEFWRRWHISLSSWFRDYVYIPLGGSRHGKWQSLRNILIIFLLSGFWHGANWTFLAWGAYHALLYVPLFVFGSNKNHTGPIVASNRWLPSIPDLWKIGVTFALVTVGWIFFRSLTISDAFQYIGGMFEDWNKLPRQIHGLKIVAVFLFLDWLSRKNERNPHAFVPHIPYIIIMTALLLIFGKGGSENIEFIYFQF